MQSATIRDARDDALVFGVRFNQGGKVHLARDTKAVTYCGRYWLIDGIDHVRLPIDSGDACRTCLRTARLADVEGVKNVTIPTVARYFGRFDISGPAIERGSTIVREGRVKPTPARVYTVEGDSGDLYRVTIVDGELPTCTCLAGKTHPERACKHMAAAMIADTGILERLERE